MSVVRRASQDEWERFREVRLRALEEAPDAFGSTLEDERTADEEHWRRWFAGWDGAANVVFVAEGEGRWSGIAVGSSATDGAHLYAMWVDPENRASGIGRALVDAVVRWAREETSADTISLWVTEGNDAASALYRASGFEPTRERRPLRDGSPLVVVEMRRPIERP